MQDPYFYIQSKVCTHLIIEIIFKIIGKTIIHITHDQLVLNKFKQTSVPDVHATL